MIARDLNGIDRRIVEIRGHIERQREIIRGLNKDGHTGTAMRAEEFLKALEGSLKILQERRKTILHRLRRPRASSKPWTATKRARRSRGA